MILNNAAAKYYSPKRNLIQVLIDNCPMNDHVFTDILEAYEVDEDQAMELMAMCQDGKFDRTHFPEHGWDFTENDN